MYSNDVPVGFRSRFMYLASDIQHSRGIIARSRGHNFHSRGKNSVKNLQVARQFFYFSRAVKKKYAVKCMEHQLEP